MRPKIVSAGKWLIPLVLLFTYPSLVNYDSFFLHTMIYFLFFMILGAGLNLLMTTGQLSIGHAAFMGIGAYTCVILVTRHGWSFWLAWAACGVLSGVMAFLLGRLTLRIKGVFFAILTFAFGEIIRMIFVNVKYFGGVNGISGIPVPNSINLGFLQFSFASKAEFYYLVLVFSLICMIMYFRLVGSQVGIVLKSINGTDLLAQCCGIDIMKYKVFAFVLGAVWAGMVGGLYAPYFTYISPHSFTFVESVDFIIISVVGGVGALSGPLFGSLFLIAVPEVFRFAKEYELIIYALSLIAVLFFLPRGIGGVMEMKMRAVRREVPGGPKPRA